MSTEDTIGKYIGTGVINVTPIASELVQLKDGEMQGCQRQKPGVEEVQAELKLAMPVYGAMAGIHPNVYQDFEKKTDLLTQIRAAKLEVGQLYEALCESEVFYEDVTERDLIRMSKMVVDTAHHDNNPGLLAVFEKTLKYRSQYAEKAAATRRKKEKEIEKAKEKAKEAANEKSTATPSV